MDNLQVQIRIPAAAGIDYAALAREFGVRRDVILLIMINNYLDAMLTPDERELTRDPVAMLRAVEQRSKRGTAPKRPPYLAPGLVADTPTRLATQRLSREETEQLRKQARYFGVSLDDLATAALLWATGADEPSTDTGHKYAPRISRAEREATEAAKLAARMAELRAADSTLTEFQARMMAEAEIQNTNGA